ncbi:plasmid mobilization relaxosome protein MobC [Marinobacter sp. SS8-8]|uniref:plasmid mobilization relaxosome protein MobC n=1 Tax=Marinobacter sp. SS8-8 TaxID=3050452 RepID=UPI0026E03229|nr:plasmid mobilization relaxosome protein MobC [Marinobacter sp. SS8-8]
MNDEKRRRKRKIQFYLSENEYENFVQSEVDSGEVNRREFVLNAIRNAEQNGAFKPKKIVVPDNLTEAVFQMKQIGNNVNQIAFKLNASDRLHIIDFENLNEALRAISEFQDIANRIKKI